MYIYIYIYIYHINIDISFPLFIYFHFSLGMLKDARKTSLDFPDLLPSYSSSHSVTQGDAHAFL